MERSRKWICLCLVAVCLFTLAGCGNTNSGADGGANSAGENGQPSTYIFKTGDSILAINDDASDLTEKIGEPVSYFEAESCAFAGLDKTFTYSGFVVTTTPDEKGADRISSVYLTDDSATTAEGIYIGCKASQLESVYGSPEEKTVAAWTYVSGDTALQFLLSGETVEAIEYFRWE